MARGIFRGCATVPVDARKVSDIRLRGYQRHRQPLACLSTEGSALPSNLESPVTRTNGPRGRDQSALPSRELFFREIRMSTRFSVLCVCVLVCVCVCVLCVRAALLTWTREK